jgi:hypothetical protein
MIHIAKFQLYHPPANDSSFTLINKLTLLLNIISPNPLFLCRQCDLIIIDLIKYMASHELRL